MHSRRRFLLSRRNDVLPHIDRDYKVCYNKNICSYCKIDEEDSEKST